MKAISRTVGFRMPELPANSPAGAVVAHAYKVPGSEDFRITWRDARGRIVPGSPPPAMAGRAPNEDSPAGMSFAGMLRRMNYERKLEDRRRRLAIRATKASDTLAGDDLDATVELARTAARESIAALTRVLHRVARVGSVEQQARAAEAVEWLPGSLVFAGRPLLQARLKTADVELLHALRAQAQRVVESAQCDFDIIANILEKTRPR